MTLFFPVAGVKKPPLAPKPKLPATTKPSPPPVAPKPGLPSHSAGISQPSPATLKRTKPAVAPKPCIPKPSASSPPVSPPPPPKPSEPFLLTRERREALGDGLLLLNSKNGISLEANKRNSDYIIPPYSRGLQDGPWCPRLENGNAAEGGGAAPREPLQNGTSAAGLAGAGPQEGAEHPKEGVAVEKGGGGGIGKKPRDKPQRQRHLDRGRGGEEQVQHREGAVAELDVSQANARTRSPDPASPCDVAGSIIAPPPSVPPSECPAESSQVECGGTISEAPSPAGLRPDLQVPAAPSKPLPVPHPRKPKKPALVRQDGVERGARDQPAGEWGRELEGREDEGDPGGDDLTPPSKDCASGDDETSAPVPPPRQTSLSPRLHRPAHKPPPLNKNTSHSLVLLSHADSNSHPKGGAEHRVEEDEEDGYGDFERYPITHSLPKQIKLGCHPPLDHARKAFSAEDQRSPRAPPRKPQRHSLPTPPPPSACPPAPPHANTPMRELPAPPQERTAWRFSRPSVTFFSRQAPSRSSVPPKGRAPALGGKQRAQSFSAADLATRADPQKRSLSFRKLLELRLSVKMLPKLRAKGGQSPDCSGVDSGRGGRSLRRPSSCVVEADIRGEYAEEPVEYENVPLYEEIPEYMNLPFHGARPGWSHDPDGADSDIYEVQDPYHGGYEHEYERYGVKRCVCVFTAWDELPR